MALARETAGCVELANRDGSGGGVGDDVDSRSTPGAAGPLVGSDGAVADGAEARAAAALAATAGSQEGKRHGSSGPAAAANAAVQCSV